MLLYLDFHRIFLIDVLILHKPTRQIATHRNLRKIKAAELRANVGEVF
jgi:hypothetical protein